MLDVVRNSFRQPTLVFAGAACAGLVAAAPAARAQSQWLDRITRAGVHLEIDKPSLEYGEESFLTTAWFVTGRTTLARNLALVAEFPFAHFDAAPLYFAGGAYVYDPAAQTAIGNPYIGIEAGAADRPGVVVEFGVRLPFASDESSALGTGLLSDVDRWEAWFGKAFAGRIGLHAHSSPERPVWLDGRAAPTVIVTTEGGYVEAFLTYGLQVRTTRESVRGGVGIGGRLHFTGGDPDTYNQLELTADVLRGSCRPGIVFRLPLDSDLSDDVGSVLGLTLSFVAR